MPANLEQIIREKGNIPGNIIEIDAFETCFNPHCALVINKVLWYALRLAIYEPEYKKLKEELVVRKITEGSLDSLKEKSKKIKKELLDGNIKSLDYSNILIREFELSSDSFSQLLASLFSQSSLLLSVYDPDDYLRPFDIIKREIGPDDELLSLGIQQYYLVKKGMDKLNLVPHHVGIYLGDKKVCHIYDGFSTSTQNANNNNQSCFSSSSNSSSNIMSNNSSESTNNPNSQSQSEKNTDRLWARIDDWERFLDKRTKIKCYHPVVHIKDSQTIIEHLKKSLQGEYGKGEYCVISKNCEHFANLIIYGINYSEQVNSYKKMIDVGKLITGDPFHYFIASIASSLEKKETNESIFNNLEKKRDLTIEEQQIFQELEARIEVRNS